MIKIKNLDCGVKVVMDKTEFVQSAAIGFWIKAGSFDEDKKNWGISHFIEHMMFKGTENRSAKEIAEDVDKIGGQINAFTGKEATCYYIKTLSANLDRAMEILVDMMVNSKFDSREMTRERKVICEEIKMIEDTPDDYAHDLIASIVNRGNPYEKTIIGTPTSLRGISRNTIVEYIEKQYTRDNIVIAVAGNFDEGSVCNYLEGNLGRFREKKPERKFDAQPYRANYKVKVKEIEQTHIFLGCPSVNLEHEDYYKVSILSNILGGSMSSRLFQNLRERKGLAYSVYCANSSSIFNGNFLIYAGVAHENIAHALGEIKNQLNILSSGSITEDELSKAKEQMKSNIIFGLENVSSKMFAVGRALTLTGKVKTESEILENIDKVTLNDVNKVATYLGDIENYSGVAVTNRKFNMARMLKK